MVFSYRRYTDTAFPAYAYTPGRDPHPRTDPRGHSYRLPGATTPQMTYRPPESWRDCPDYLYGCDLYNHAYWWEAHEVWEGLWHLAPRVGMQRRFLQGLIQLSIGHLKLRMGAVDDARRLRVRSDRYLFRVADDVGDGEFMGLAVRRWLETLRAYDERWMAMPPPKSLHNPRTFPYLVLSLPSGPTGGGLPASR